MAAEETKHKEIYTYDAPWIAYGMNWSARTDKLFRLALGSFIEEYNNVVQIIQLDIDSGVFKVTGQFDHSYPTTKIVWNPDTSLNAEDLLATTGDYLRIWNVNKDNSITQKCLLNNNKNSEFCAPLTSFDWNEIDTSIIGTSSIDTTCTIWSIETQQAKTQLIAHDKEVYDISFAPSATIFASSGADGSVRMFDLRSLEHSTIVYESPNLVPLLRLAWNKQATFLLNQSQVIILDIRVPSAPVAELQGHTGNVNAITWAHHSSCHICSGADDRQALIWNLEELPKPIEDPQLAYESGGEISQLQWSATHTDWIGKFIMAIVECVPNFSEGSDKSIIEAIATAIRSVPFVTLMDVDMGASTNRSIFTFVGSPDSVVEAAFQAAKVAKDLIDMRKQHGEHPRNSAMDVCPFIPISNIRMEDCVSLAHRLAKRLADELFLPSYLYEEASQRDYRKSLRQLRGNGEYEGLENKLKLPEWAPDYGPSIFVPSWGVSAVGARSILIAYNVFGTKEQAHRIALNVREQGRKETEPGTLKKVKAIGWFVEDYGIAQVSMNLDDWTVTPPHMAFEEIRKEASILNIAIAGSEIVGVVPLQAMLVAAEYYIKKENLFLLDESVKVKLAIDRLGLSSCKPFIPKTKIIEYMISDAMRPNNLLIDQTLENFIGSVQARTSAPGGGSVSAVAGALGAALGQMMGWMSYGNREWAYLGMLLLTHHTAYSSFIFHDRRKSVYLKNSTMRKLIPPIDKIVSGLIPCNFNYLSNRLNPIGIDNDTFAFADYMSADEKKIREQAMQEGLKKATIVPLRTMRLASDKEMWESLIHLSKIGNLNSASDLEVGAKMLETAVWGAHRNVLINIVKIYDTKFVKETTHEADALLSFTQSQFAILISELDKRKANQSIFYIILNNL